ncbi:T9SS type A sorting domain-containing protein [Fibrella forsythiae]|uniref:T9SS type A sorting domain-containing protein n=1 Tax=Fibrella forsythiae TaxID=2817061 RepID=A0ABS3JR18_9BACT|nr:T9SS type A sorting domain-containing protein [Fibrella forsythiae]MBO0952461.1 T9SS type A sorting domain-containing protein [Fibrella forsythiae]
MIRLDTCADRFVLIALGLLIALSAAAQSPSNLTANAPWDEDAGTAGQQITFSGTTAIQNAFTNARRQEEIQLGLPTNVLGNLVLPSGWSGYTNNEKAYTLLNAERTARAGITYASGTVLGLPFEASDVNLGAIAQAHANYLKTNNLFTHTGAGGTTPFDRIKAVYPQTTPACSEFLSRAENIAIFGSSGSSGNPMIIERAVYNWIYDDASSSWGHREACLLQDKDLANNNSLYGFKNNYGSSGSEGFVNIATAGATDGSYPYFGAGFPSVDVVVLMIMDPVSSANATANGCTYNLSSPPLPVELLSFKVSLTPSSQVRIDWETASELNSSRFTIERSRDLINIDDVADVDASGTMQGRKSYVAYDKAPLSGVSYYRIKQIDRDGQSEVFRWLPITYIPDNFVAVFPNPGAGDYIRVELAASEPASVRLFDLLGRNITVTSHQTEPAKLTVQPASVLPAGSYLLSINQNGVSVVKHIVVR